MSEKRSESAQKVVSIEAAVSSNTLSRSDKLCSIGRNVIEVEAKVIANLASRINHDFAQACEILLSCKGRIAVIGVGKSGHISRKIAATFASTGSPAFFLHPSEAKHGDIGMLTPNDVVIAISNSGESEEIVAILPVMKHLNTTLISLTGRPESTLAKSAAINLDVSVDKEACPLGLAPTSSTTAALVMGDALAMALLDMRGFTVQDFALSHPGGALGRRLLLKVDAMMHQNENIPSVSMEATLKDALVEMTQKKLGMTTVLNDTGKLVGIFTDGDVRRALDNNTDIKSTQMHQVMSKNPKTIPTDTLAAAALSLMEKHKITSLVVVDADHHPLGIIHIHDILRAGIV
jgi:arabinose-5-phosphate isomerase